jgi:hypothetical protein
MKNILDWLDANISDSAFTFDDNTDVERQAEIIRAKAEVEGYSADELLQACGGDIAEYLRNRQAGAGSDDADGKMAGDVSPIIAPGFNQQ